MNYSQEQVAALIAEILGDELLLSNCIITKCNGGVAGQSVTVKVGTKTVTAIAINSFPPGDCLLLKEDTSGQWYVVGAPSKIASQSTITYRRYNYEPPADLAINGQIQVLYYIVSEGNYQYYVGGDRIKPVLVASFPVSYSRYITSFVTNLGNKQYSANVKYSFRTGAFTVDNKVRIIANKNGVSNTYNVNYNESQVSRVYTKRYQYVGEGYWLSPQRQPYFAVDSTSTVTLTGSPPCQGAITDISSFPLADVVPGISYTQSLHRVETGAPYFAGCYRPSLVEASSGSGDCRAYYITPDDGENFVTLSLTYSQSANESATEPVPGNPGTSTSTREDTRELTGISPILGDTIYHLQESLSTDSAPGRRAEVFDSTAIVYQGLSSRITERLYFSKPTLSGSTTVDASDKEYILHKPIPQLSH